MPGSYKPRREALRAEVAPVDVRVGPQRLPYLVAALLVPPPVHLHLLAVILVVELAETCLGDMT